MKILHIASFVGNIGDNASHMGLNNILKSFFTSFSVTEVEIRRFYKNYANSDKKYFDKTFIEIANQYDLMIIGGGGFLDYWVPNSSTGTTIDIHPKLIPLISVPTLITSVGCNPHKDIPSGNIEKFRDFLDACLKNENIKISIRSDGSTESLKEDIGLKYYNEIPEVLDSGFFYHLNSDFNEYAYLEPYVAINISDDQINMRSKVSLIDNKELYYSELAKSCEFIAYHLNKNIIFIPHIYSDLKAISNVLEKINDWTIRTKITIANCAQYNEGANRTFSIYKHAQLTIGTRYHANVCSMALGTNCIGLAALDRVKYLYDLLQMPENSMSLTGMFSASLNNKVINASKKLLSYNARLELLKQQTLNTYQDNFQQLKLI